MQHKRLAVIVAMTLGSWACGNTADSSNTDEGLATQEGTIPWGPKDAPSLFDSTLEMRLSELPQTGEAARIPWAGSYWPTYEDNINKRWAGAGTDSPAMKYQKAFGGTNVENAVSRYHGIDSATGQKACAASTDCDSGQRCAMRQGATSGRCIPSWWGICHAWAPAAILMPEPLRPVTKNGVEFRVQDLKALASLVHNNVNTRFVSLRCNVDASNSGMKFDEYGRPISGAGACQDTNAGTYHVLLANYLGKRRQSFVEDRTYDHEVWNQPMRGYEVLEQRDVTYEEANALVGVKAKAATEVTRELTLATTLGWFKEPAIAVTPGKKVLVTLSGTGDSDLFVKFNAQASDLAYDCRSIANNSSTEKCELTVPADATQVFVAVRSFTPSVAKLSIQADLSVPSKYLFNDKARTFAYVKTRVKYIRESSSQTDGNLASSIDRYTGTDLYEYVLELDEAGKIIGGEWVGSSKTAHPDFLWLPTSVSSRSVAGGAIKYDNIKAMMDEASQPVRE